MGVPLSQICAAATWDTHAPLPVFSHCCWSPCNSSSCLSGTFRQFLVRWSGGMEQNESYDATTVLWILDDRVLRHLESWQNEGTSFMMTWAYICYVLCHPRSLVTLLIWNIPPVCAQDRYHLVSGSTSAASFLFHYYPLIELLTRKTCF